VAIESQDKKILRLRINDIPKSIEDSMDVLWWMYWWMRIQWMYSGGGLRPPPECIPGLGIFLGLVDSSLTGSRSTAYQNRPGFSVLHA